MPFIPARQTWYLPDAPWAFDGSVSIFKKPDTDPATWDINALIAGGKRQSSGNEILQWIADRKKQFDLTTEDFVFARPVLPGSRAFRIPALVKMHAEPKKHTFLKVTWRNRAAATEFKLRRCNPQAKLAPQVIPRHVPSMDEDAEVTAMLEGAFRAIRAGR